MMEHVACESKKQQRNMMTYACVNVLCKSNSQGGVGVAQLPTQLQNVDKDWNMCFFFAAFDLAM